jgi:hypothetical protein
MLVYGATGWINFDESAINMTTRKTHQAGNLLSTQVYLL